jgi:hypothetical protein
MKLYCSLYWDPQLEGKKKRVLKKILHNKWQIEKYLICLTQNESNHLEIFQSALLLQKKMVDSERFLVGIAGSYQGALEIVEKITQEVYDNTKNVDIRNYILNKQNEFEKENV